MADSMLQMAVMPGRERSWADGDDLVYGYVVLAADVAWASTPAELVDAHALGFPGSPFSSDSTAVDVLRFRSTPFTRLVAATGASTAGGELLGEGFVDHPPFTGTGFVAVENHIVPLWWLEPTRVPPGAELYRIHGDGREELLATYLNVASGWQPASPPSFLPADVVGTFATWHNTPVPADPLGADRVVVASPVEREGLRLTERGVWGGLVSADDLAEVYALRVTASWRGLPVQVVRRWQSEGRLLARLVFVGRDVRVAEAAGLQKMAAGAYEATAPIDELEDLQVVQLVPAP
jgi:hypothetical protein